MVILGTGYVGKAFSNENPHWLATQRRNTNLSTYFEANTPSSWLHQGEKVLITFSLAIINEDLWVSFADYIKSNFKDVYVLASTSRFQGTVVNECSKTTDELRVKREEQLLQNGARVIALAGIYGPERCPLKWLQKGLISLRKQDVNLIHIKDIVNLLSECMAKLPLSERLILWDGSALPWSEVEAFAKDYLLLPSSFLREDKEIRRGGKKLQNKKLLELIPGYSFVKWKEHLVDEYALESNS